MALTSDALFPFPPVLRGRGARGEEVEAPRTSAMPRKGFRPPSPQPSPPEYGGRGSNSLLRLGRPGVCVRGSILTVPSCKIYGRPFCRLKSGMGAVPVLVASSLVSAAGALAGGAWL